MKISGYPYILRSSIFKDTITECTFFVTSRCNFRCSHCFFWKDIEESNKKNELTIKEIERLVRKFPRLLRLILTGGEPFLRDDIVWICRVFYKYSRPGYITIPTNGYLSDKILRDVSEILKECSNTFFNISLSLSELGDMHDKSVDKKDSFERLLKTNEYLQTLKKRFSNLAVTVITIQTAENEDRLGEIFDFAMEKMRVDNFGFGPIRSGPKNDAITRISPAKFKAMCQTISLHLRKKYSKRLTFPLKKFFLVNREMSYEYKYKVLIDEIKHSECFSGVLRAVIREDGEVYPCETLMDKGREYSMGNLRDFDMDFARLWRSNRRQEVARRIKMMKCVCRHGCDVSTNMLFNFHNWPKLIWRAALYR